MAGEEEGDFGKCPLICLIHHSMLLSVWAALEKENRDEV